MVYSKEYYQENKEKISRYRKKWRKANPNWAIDYYNKNKNKLLEYKRKYYKKWRMDNKKSCSKSQKVYYQRNKDIINCCRRDYVFFYNNRINFGGNKELVYKRDNYSCVCCGMSQRKHIIIFNKKLTVDHIDGNRNNNSLNNLQTLCSKCHGSKDSKRYWKNKQTGEIQCVC